MSLKQNIQDRMGFYHQKGMIPKLPSPFQVRRGLKIMMPLYLSESPREREISRSTMLGQVPFRVWFQMAYCPAMLKSTSGLDLRPEQLVRHILCVYHEDAFLGYDLQVLRSHPKGLALLKHEAQKVVEGKTRWAPLLQKLVGDPGYHKRLISMAEEAEKDRFPDVLDLDPRFSTLIGFADFCAGLPEWPKLSFYGFDFSSFKKRQK